MDGVLVDESESYRQAIQATYRFFTKKEVTAKQIQELKDEGGFNNDWDATEELVKRTNFNVEKKEIINKFQEFYLGTDKVSGFRDNEEWLLSKEILKDLANNYALGIVNGRPIKEAKYVLEKEKVSKYFDVLVGMEDMERQKPDPFGINLALEKIGGEAVYVGDSVDDMEAAKNAKIVGIGVIPPQGNETYGEVLKEKGAKVVIEKVDQIVEVLE